MLMFMDGFDAYSASADLTKKWGQMVTWTLNTSSGRFGTNCISTAAASSSFCGGPSTTWGVANADYFNVGCWFIGFGKPTNDQSIWMANNNTQATFGVGSASGRLMWVNAGNLSGPNLCDSQWHWIEFRQKWTSGATVAGDLTTWVDGVLALTSTSTFGTGQQISSLWVNTNNTMSTTFRIDDIFFFNNVTGTVTGDLTNANQPIGPQKIYTIRGASAGSVTGWTPDSGSNYARVNEVNPDGDTSYITGLGSLTRDTYTTDDITGTDTSVLVANVNMYAKNNGAGTAASIQGLGYSGGNYTLGDSRVVTSAYTTLQTPIYRDPSNVAWTAATINSTEFGVGVV